LEDVYETLDDKAASVGLFADLAKAFDLVKPQYFTIKIACIWYQRNRTQMVCFLLKKQNAAGRNRLS